MRYIWTFALAYAISGCAAYANMPGKTLAKVPDHRTRLAATCFKTGEDAPSGSMTKICYYSCLGSPAAITISAVAICPLSIDR